MRSKIADRILAKTTQETKDRVRKRVNSMISNRLQILEYNYLEHFKHAKDLALVLPIEHPKRKEIESELNKIILEINKLKKVK
jgi:hypothetical protein